MYCKWHPLSLLCIDIISPIQKYTFANIQL